MSKDQAPWPFITASRAARLLGVDHSLIAGLAAGRDPKLRAVKVKSKKGNIVWLLNYEDVDALAHEMSEQ